MSRDPFATLAPPKPLPCEAPVHYCLTCGATIPPVGKGSKHGNAACRKRLAEQESVEHASALTVSVNGK